MCLRGSKPWETLEAPQEPRGAFLRRVLERDEHCIALRDFAGERVRQQPRVAAL